MAAPTWRKNRAKPMPVRDRVSLNRRSPPTLSCDTAPIDARLLNNFANALPNLMARADQVNDRSPGTRMRLPCKMSMFRDLRSTTRATGNDPTVMLAVTAWRLSSARPFSRAAGLDCVRIVGRSFCCRRTRSSRRRTRQGPPRSDHEAGSFPGLEHRPEPRRRIAPLGNHMAP